MSSIREIRKHDFQSQVIEHDRPVLVDFYASWCPPCKMLTPVLEQLAGQLGDEVKICKVNVDKDPELAQAFQVTGVPSMFLFENGELTDTMVGMRPPQELLSKLQAAIGRTPAGVSAN